MNTNDLLRKLVQFLPNTSVSEDNNGQAVVNTGLYSVAGTGDLFGAPEESGADELFVVRQLSRGGIAEELNATLDREEFAEDDSRLTTEICERYAERFGDTLANCDGDDDRQAEVIGEMTWEFLRETWGIDV